MFWALMRAVIVVAGCNGGSTSRFKSLFWFICLLFLDSLLKKDTNLSVYLHIYLSIVCFIVFYYKLLLLSV